MIYDSSKSPNVTMDVSARISTALNYLRKTDFSKLEPGKYPIEGTEIFALVQQYETKEKVDGKWEAHKKYIDIQYVADGEKLIGYADVKRMSEQQEYNPEKDIQFFNGEGSFIKVGKGEFMILYPEDVHMPEVKSSVKQNVRKVVVKVLV
jgi:YhcH/YjgK/YiaL family protein